MINRLTNEPIRVGTIHDAGPFFKVMRDQVPEIRRRLDMHPSILYWVDSNAISVNHGPYTVYVNFGRAVDPVALQAILDEPD